MDMISKQSAAKKRYWATKTTEQKSEHMRHRAIIKWSKLSKEKRKAHSQKMLKARWSKKLSTK